MPRPGTASLTAVALLAIAFVRPLASPAPRSFATPSVHDHASDLAFAEGGDDPAAADVARPPAVAGTFYPADADVLRRTVDALLREAHAPVVSSPVAIVAPHAGYVYSGRTLADAFSQVRGREYGTIVLLGANHTGRGRGRMALWPGGSFVTPLGAAAIDRDVTGALLDQSRDLRADVAPHEREHSIEVLVPFVQTLFPTARIVAIVVGNPDPGACARLGRDIAAALNGRRALVVASSDLSHYPSASDAAPIDRRTLDAIASLDASRLLAHARAVGANPPPREVTIACGLLPVLTAMSAAIAMGADRGTVVSYATSAEAPPRDTSRVVGYGAVVWHGGEPRGGPAASGWGRPAAWSTSTAQPPANGAATVLEAPAGGRRHRAGMAVSGVEVVAGWGQPGGDGLGSSLDEGTKARLLELARRAIASHLEAGSVPVSVSVDAALAERRQGAFVTLERGGRLRGCIGRLTGELPLAELIARVAVESAVRDRRFPPVRAGDLAALDIEISLLSPPRVVREPLEIVVGRDGVVLQKDGRLAVFLPRVAVDEGWTRDRLLEELCAKAGLQGGCWRNGAVLATFQAEVFSDRDRHAHGAPRGAVSSAGGRRR